MQIAGADQIQILFSLQEKKRNCIIMHCTSNSMNADTHPHDVFAACLSKALFWEASLNYKE